MVRNHQVPNFFLIDFTYVYTVDSRTSGLRGSMVVFALQAMTTPFTFFHASLTIVPALLIGNL